MEYVVVRWDSAPGGYWLDPRPYQAALPHFASRLPRGARAYAQDPEHYDFASDRCVKDLWFSSFTVNEHEGAATLALAPHASKHSVGLRLHYLDVKTIEVERERDPGVGWLGSLLLDEVLPSGAGLSHEAMLTGGVLRVVCADLEATWG